MNIPMVTQSETMSSTQLAEMLGYEKKEINKKVRAMFGDEVAREKFYPALDSQNRVNYYNLPELESKMFVAKHDIQYLEMITQYWIDKSKPQIPDFNNAVLMARTWADDQEEKQRLASEKETALVEVDRLQGVCQTITAQFKVGMTPCKFALQLNGVNVKQVNSALVELKKLRATGTGYSPTAIARDDILKANMGDHGEYATLLPKGAKWLYRAYLAGKLPMKKTWNGKYVHLIFK